MINPDLPQLESTTLAQYFGLDVEALLDHLDWLRECRMEDEVIQAEIAEEVGKKV